MRKTLNFILLDLISIKSEIKILLLIPIVLLTILGYRAMGASGIALGFVPFVNTFVAFPFAAGNNGLDTLYSSLSISRYRVVVNRYLFTIVFALAIAILFLIIGITAASVMGDEVNILMFVMVISSVFVMATFMSAVNLPILFRMGFKKAKPFATIFPMFITMGLWFFVNNREIDFDQLPAGFSEDLTTVSLTSSAVFGLVGIALVWLLVLFCSHLISFKLYNKRDF